MTGPRKAWLAGYSWDFDNSERRAVRGEKCLAQTHVGWPRRDARIVVQASSGTDGPGRSRGFMPPMPSYGTFCFYNGNTFTAVIRDVVHNLELEPNQIVIVRSLAGHIVAGVASDEETRAFREFCATLT